MKVTTLCSQIAGFQSCDYDDARGRRKFSWRAGSKNGEYVYGGNHCRESLLYGFRASFETKIQANKYVGRDPYHMKMSDFLTEPKDLPTIEAVDITNYLVLQTSYYTKQQMKAYKSLEAYHFFVSGSVPNDSTMIVVWFSPGWVFVWCKQLAVAAIMSTNLKHILTTTLAWQYFVFKVNHSQRQTLVCLLQIRAQTKALSCLFEIQHSLCTFRPSLLLFLELHPLLSLKRWLWFGHSFLVTEVDRRSPVYRLNVTQSA